jgi:hypothetical protein
MLFDLQGKRRRLVQGTYLVLAILMGGGLILFGVGSGNISGGLFDALTGKNSNSSTGGNSIVDKRIKADQRAIVINPNNTQAMADLVRAHYQLAGSDEDQNTGVFGDQGKAELRKASAAWQKYIGVAKKPDPSLAALMLNAYGDIGLKDDAHAAEAAEFVADAQPSAQAYLQLAQYAAKAGQTRKAQLAGQKALQLAPKSQKKLVQQQIQALSAASAGATTTTSG